MSKETDKLVSKRMSTALTTPVPDHLKALQTSLRTLVELKDLMVLDVDFGRIPGTPRPSCYQGGAQIIRKHYNYQVKFTMEDLGSDITAGIFNYYFNCDVSDEFGSYIGNGVGSCSSQETKFRYRWVERGAAPLPSPEAKDFDLYGFSDLYRSINGKASVKIQQGRPPQFRIQNEEAQDLQNTIIKRAKKRAFIDAMLMVSGASRLFMLGDEAVEVTSPEEAAHVVEAESVKVTDISDAKEIKEDKKDKVDPAARQAFIDEAKGLFKDLNWGEVSQKSWLTKEVRVAELKDVSVGLWEQVINELKQLVQVQSNDKEPKA